MKLRSFVLLAMYPMAVASQAMGEEPSKASFSLQFSGLRSSTTTTKVEQNGIEQSSKTSSILTLDLVDAYVWLTWDRFNVYLYPFQDANALFTATYMVTETVELGFDFGFNTTKTDQPKDELTARIFGLTGTLYTPLPNDITLETGLVLDATENKNVFIDNAGLETSSTSKGRFGRLNVGVVVPLAKNAWYYGGASLSLQTTKTDNTSKKSTASQFGLTLAALRVTLD